MDTWMLIAAGGVFVVAIGVYGLIYFFLPEWVGVTGKVALETERSHRDGEPAKKESMLDRMQK